MFQPKKWESEADAMRNIAMLLGLAKGAGIVSPEQEQCVIDSVWSLVGRSPVVTETEFREAFGLPSFLRPVKDATCR